MTTFQFCKFFILPVGLAFKNWLYFWRIEHAGEYPSESLLNAMVLNGLPERYEHFVVQGSFNPAGIFVELWTRLLNDEDDVDSHVVLTSKKPTPRVNNATLN